MLIMGAFFAVAALAFLAALRLAYTEQQEILAKAIALPEKKTAMVAKTPVLVMEQEEREKALRIPIAKETRQEGTREPRTRMSSGQLLELALELRSLQAQAGEINERLHLLSTMLEEQIEEMAVSPLELREGRAV